MAQPSAEAIAAAALVAAKQAVQNKAAALAAKAVRDAGK